MSVSIKILIPDSGGTVNPNGMTRKTSPRENRVISGTEPREAELWGGAGGDDSYVH